jgi:hypothetical protein
MNHSELRKTTTDTEICFHLSGERILPQYIYKFLVHKSYDLLLTNEFINVSFAQHTKKIEAYQCLLEDLPLASLLFQAVHALATRTEWELRFPLSWETDTEQRTPEFEWLLIRHLLR